MNVKRIIRDRVYRVGVFSPVITLLLCSRFKKKKRRTSCLSLFKRSIVPPFYSILLANSEVVSTFAEISYLHEAWSRR